MRGALALAFAVGAVLGSTAPALGQPVDLSPDPTDPRTAAETKRWLDATLQDLESGRKVIVPLRDGPLPYLVVDRAELSEAPSLAAVDGGSRGDPMRWSAGVLGEQGELRSRFARTREKALALSGGRDSSPIPRPPPLVAVVRGTPDAAGTPPRPDTDVAGTGPTPDPTPTDPGLDPSSTTLAAPADIDVSSFGSPAPPTPAPAIIGGGGGGVRANRSIGTGVQAAIGLGLLALLLGAALVASRRRPVVAAARPARAPGPRIDLALDVSGPAGERSARFSSAPIAIGRDPTSDLALEDPRVSRRHARIVVQGRELWIEDVGSAAGLEVDGRTVDRARLARGTAARLGDTRLRVR